MEAELLRVASAGILMLILREAELNLRMRLPEEERSGSTGSGVVRLVWEELRLRLRMRLTKLLPEEPRRESMERASLWERLELLFLRPRLAAEKPRERPTEAEEGAR
jgi:hypothetical protein